MTYTQIIGSTSIFLLGCFCTVMTSAQSQKTYQSTVKLLSEMKSPNLDKDKLAKLFRTGDERIADLVRALDDPKPDMSRRAQIVIRYLGNDVGMKELLKWYGRREQFPVAGPIPLPLREWDYKVIDSQYINQPQGDWTRAESYIYALALDDSPKAKEALEKLLNIAGNLDEATVANHAAKRVQVSQPAKMLSGKKDLAELVLNNAFFVSPQDRKYSTARLLALNGSKDKGLVEVYINRGVLSEEWYHVVIQKCEQGWQFFSITQVAVS